MCFSWEVLDKSAVKVCKAEESSNITEVARYLLVSDGGNFALVHADMAGFDDHTKVLNAIAIKLTFLRFQIQIVLFETVQDFMHCFLMHLFVNAVD